MPKSNVTTHRVSQQLSFAIYGVANRITRMHKPLLEPLGLTFPQYLVMLELYAATPLTVGELGTALDMDTGTITPLLKRLANLGMITRTRDPEDERRVLINLTEAGESIRKEVCEVSGKISSACPISNDELLALRDTLNNLAQQGKN